MRSRGDQRGQSVVEFLIFLPILVLFVVTTIQVNTAIQIAIVNQKYSRAQTFVLAANSAVYPDLQRRYGPGNFFGDKEIDQMNLGISDNKAVPGYFPTATVVRVSRRGKPTGNNEEQKEDHTQRGLVRIRNNVTLCTQFNPEAPEDINDPVDLRATLASGGFRYCRGTY